MPSRRSTLLVAAVAGLVVLSLTACAGQTPGDPGTPSDEPQTLTVYSGRDAELIDPLMEMFEEQSGIDVEVRYAGTTELAAQLLEEGERTPAQVFLSQDAGALGAVSDAGMFATLPDEITSLVPAEYTSSDGSWVGLTGRARVIAYDSEKYTADQVPGDVLELVEPEWAGKVGIVPSNASFQAFVTALRVSEGEDVARSWLEGLVAGDAPIYASNGELLEAVNSGAVDLGLINHYYWARSEQDPATLRAQLKFGDPGSISALVNVTGVGVLTGAADSPEAIALVEFLVSEEAQTYFREETFEYPLVGDLPGPEGVPAREDLGAPDIDLSDLASLQETVALITEAGLL
ncbi:MULTISPECIES: iron ABC transporter substrate-binding protein [unclassified Microbacterium]|uniref:iron ABC transporter substrate-binding protein n=1 Tax=unclassified Microbacterium TaxID=2609290 RepID=UPI000F5563BF|nr:iron ABC transporter substrate-binding protein [Microbacterium sp. ABRD28]AZC14667.1 iron ABC transporter substrate-binding protein [Microbacterium sp. ABRD28]